MEKLELTIGSDPEIVIANKDRRPVSAIAVLKTDKDNPIDLGDGVKLYADNALAELSFPPSSLDKIVGVMANAFAKAKSKLEGYHLLAQAATMFQMKELESFILNAEGQKKCTAWDIGCSENFDVYKWEANPKGTFTDGLRTGSFHIHIGNANYLKGGDDRLLSRDSKKLAVKLMDMYVGIASIVFDKDPSAHARRKLYGRAGEMRPTKYGVEYRVLGNYALRSTSLMQLVFDLTGLAMSHIENGSGKDRLAFMPEAEVIRIINENDVKSAVDVVCQLGLPSSMLSRVLSRTTIPNSDVLSS